MDETQNSQSNFDNGENEQTPEMVSEKVFDITPDLNISQVTDGESKEVVTNRTIPLSEQPLTPLQQAIGKLNLPNTEKQKPNSIPPTPNPSSKPNSQSIPNNIAKEPPKIEVKQSTIPLQTNQSSFTPNTPVVNQRDEQKNDIVTNFSAFPKNPFPATETRSAPTMPESKKPEILETSASGNTSPLPTTPTYGQISKFSTDVPAPIVPKPENKVPEPVVIPKPVPPTPITTPTPAPIPSPVKKDQPAPTTIDEKGNVKREENSSTGYSIANDPQKPLRTYESDIAEALARKKMSMASIAIAENNRKQEEGVVKPRPNPSFFAPTPKPEPAPKPAEQPKKEEPKPIVIPTPTPPPQPIKVQAKENIPGEQRGEVGAHMKTKEEVSAQQIDSQQLSNVKPMAMSPRPSHHVWKKILIFLISLTLIGGGGYTVYYFYINSPISQEQPAITNQVSQNNNLLPTDSVYNISIDDKNASQILKAIQTEANKDLKQGIEEVSLIKTVKTTTMKVTSGDMLSILGLELPDTLIRSLTGNWLLGIYSDGAGNNDVFVILEHNFFQNAFVGMLSWEPNMANDLKTYIPPQKQVTASTNGATSSPSKPLSDNQKLYMSLNGHFIDGIVKNKDVREFKSDTGQVVFVYSLIDNNKIVISGKESTLNEIIKRLEKQSRIR